MVASDLEQMKYKEVVATGKVEKEEKSAQGGL